MNFWHTREITDRRSTSSMQVLGSMHRLCLYPSNPILAAPVVRTLPEYHLHFSKAVGVSKVFSNDHGLA
ncbi:hypothetical protein BD311DRAFT_751855 [Dichomitus squalens]|uniref:Uncharacterized protein n=1 Tax=Dichomitus squalens TaxID=114155 RepID=A0A4Q9MYQ9_9APHY|nr:hypothetical protein BD311DRAFT_751855 [Dichomitus squalens]